MCVCVGPQEGVEVRVARIFNTFGSRMHMNDGRVVSNFILQALQGEPLTVGLYYKRPKNNDNDLTIGLLSVTNGWFQSSPLFN